LFNYIIILKDNILEFHSKGDKIENPKGIFKKYKRENKILVDILD
jgi:hypothetical protein